MFNVIKLVKYHIRGCLRSISEGLVVDCSGVSLGGCGVTRIVCVADAVSDAKVANRDTSLFPHHL